MTVPKDFETFVTEQLAAAGSLRRVTMFGAVGLYLDDVFCVFLDAECRVWFRVGDSNRADFEAEGMEQLRPVSVPTGMPYYEVPAHVLESPQELCAWALRAREAGLVAAKTKKKRTSRRKRKA